MRFLADNTVGKLRRWMSLLGYDVVYDPRSARQIVRDPEIRAGEEVVLGRCPGLAHPGAGGQDAPVRPGLFFHVESPVLEEQLAQVTRAFPLPFGATLFTRCSHCNTLLEGPLALEALSDQERERVPERVRAWRQEYFLCRSCGRVYWDGTHTERVREVLRREVGLEI